MVEPGDAELVERCLRGAEEVQESFRLLFERHAPAVGRFLRGALGDEEQVRDALQETFLQLYRALERWHPERPFRPWALGVAAKVARGLRRTAARRPLPPLPDHVDPPDEEAQVSEAVSREEERRSIREAIGELPAEEREVFLLRHVEGLTFEEAAVVLGCSVRTAKTRMRGALTLLGVGLRRRGLVDREVAR